MDKRKSGLCSNLLETLAMSAGTKRAVVCSQLSDVYEEKHSLLGTQV